MFPQRIETDRLVLERLDESVELFEFYRICSSDPGIDDVTRYMPWTPHRNLYETRQFLGGVRENWTKGTEASYAIRVPASERDLDRQTDERSETGAFAGVGSIEIDWSRQLGSLGTWLRKPYWGRGYSGERADALIELAFDRLDLEIVTVTHHVDNEKSRCAIEKYVERNGGRREGTLRNWLPYDDHVADEVRYTISYEEWAEARRDQ